VGGAVFRQYDDAEVTKARCLLHLVRKHGFHRRTLAKMWSLVPCWKIRGCGACRNLCAWAIKTRRKR